MVRIRPRRRDIIPGITSWLTRSVATLLTVIISTTSFSGVWANVTGMECERPTLLIKIEISRSLIRSAMREYSTSEAEAKSMAKVLISIEPFMLEISSAREANLEEVRDTRRREKFCRHS